MGKNLSRELRRQFFKNIIVYAGVVLLILFAGQAWCKSRIWYSSDPWYWVLKAVERYLVVFVLILFLVGCVIISCLHFAKIAKLMEQIVEAVDDMSTERVRFVTLPPSIHEVEEKLNQILTTTRESRQAAKESEKRKNDMLVYMAHDLKTPLTSVLGYLTLLKEEQNITPELREKYVGIAWNKANRLENLINDFFEVTRMNLAYMELELYEVNISRMMEQLLYEFRPLMEQKNLSYELTMDEDVMVSCDVDKMERVLDNLMKNAINYCYPDTQIQVKLQKEESGQVRITIRNQGKTIPKEKLKMIFEQFFRMDSSRSSATGGTGLGLAIAKQIIELHGGWIRCESENETITFVFVI